MNSRNANWLSIDDYYCLGRLALITSPSCGASHRSQTKIGVYSIQVTQIYLAARRHARVMHHLGTLRRILFVRKRLLEGNEWYQYIWSGTAQQAVI